MTGTQLDLFNPSSTPEPDKTVKIGDLVTGQTSTGYMRSGTFTRWSSSGLVVIRSTDDKWYALDPSTVKVIGNG